MTRTLLRTVAFATVAIPVSLFAVDAASVDARADDVAPECRQFKDVLIETKLASAGTFSNYWNREGSIRFESNAIFEAAKAKADSLVAPEGLCPSGCGAEKQGVKFVFRSTPNKFRSDNDDAKHCEDLLRRTTATPLRYQTTELRTIAELESWIGDLSQGDGEFGEDLYEKCDGECSPQFEYTIVRTHKTPAAYLVSATIICGAARDKDDDQYKLDSFFRWTCEPAA